MYVWFDALTNYVNVVGFGSDEDKFNQWWPVVQTCGPDNLKFQSIIWQAMLASAKLPFSEKILIHAYVLGSDGRKMSKTIGNVVSPFEQIEKYSSDTVRFYLLAGLPTFSDSSYKEDDLINLYNGCLADNFGNLINRVIVLCKSKGIEADERNISKEFQKIIESKQKAIQDSFEAYNLYEACQEINSLLSYANKYINDQKPWEIENPSEVLNNLIYLLLIACDLYEPIIPESSKRAKDALNKMESIILFEKLGK